MAGKRTPVFRLRVIPLAWAIFTVGFCAYCLATGQQSAWDRWVFVSLAIATWSLIPLLLYLAATGGAKLFRIWRNRRRAAIGGGDA
jgi:hypothetical protein